MQIVISTDNLESEIRQLQDDLAAAEALRVRPEDVHANAIRKQLSDKQAELLAAQFAEGVELGKQQRARELALLTELEKEIDRAKTETLTLRRLISETPGRLAAAEYKLGQLLRQHSKLKIELGV
jgi:hypothetical protein